MSFSGKSDEDDNEFAWTQDPFSRNNSLHLGLQDLDQTMRCQICCNFYRAPVSIPNCHHTFCSECLSGHVRAGMTSAKRSASCPICRQKIIPHASNIPNRTVEDMVRKFTQIRNSLLLALKKAESMEASNIEKVQSDEDENRTTSVRRSSSRRKDCVSSDISTKQEENFQEVIHSEIITKKLPKCVYHGLKKKQLQKKCQELGLNADGDEAQLKARHQEYVLLHNAQCDSFHPRPKSELIKEVHERERVKRKILREERMSEVGIEKGHWNQLIKSRNEEGTATSSGDTSFDAKLESNFARMMKELRAKREASKTPAAAPAKEAEAERKINQLVAENAEKAVGKSGDEVDSIREHANVRPSPRCVQRKDDENSNDSSVVVLLPSTQRMPSPSPSSNIVIPSPNTSEKTSKEKILDEEVSAAKNVKERKRAKALIHETTHRSKRSSVGPWNCTHCTFYNKNATWSTARCEMCRSVRSS